MKKKLIKRIIANIVNESKAIGALIEVEGAYTGNHEAYESWACMLKARQSRLKANRARLNKLIFGQP